MHKIIKPAYRRNRCIDSSHFCTVIKTTKDLFMGGQYTLTTNPRWRGPPFWKPLINFNEIWHGDAHWHSLCQRTFKIAILKIQHGGRPPSWKIKNSPYLSNGLADLDDIWQDYSDWVSQSYQPVRIWSFENPRWRRPPFWKTVKLQYPRNRLTDFD